MAKKKRYRGDYCKVCGRILPNEKFSGKGYAAHICKACAKKPEEKLGIRALGRQVIGRNGSFKLREAKPAYTTAFGLVNVDLEEENAYYWDVSD